MGRAMWIGKRQSGFTYLGIMLLIFVIGIGLTQAGLLWKTEVKREREKELLFIGQQYASALASYYDSTPSQPKQYPNTLAELLHDNRFAVTKRHLRQLYPDPITGSKEWGFIREQGRISGIYSLSTQAPLKKAGFAKQWESFASAANYRDWKFIAQAGVNVMVHIAPSETIKPPEPAKKHDPAPPLTPEQEKKSTCLAQRSRDNVACAAICNGTWGSSECKTCQSDITNRFRACLQ